MSTTEAGATGMARLREDDVDALHRTLAATNDPNIRSHLAGHYDSLPTQLARRFAQRGEPFDDLQQEARIALLQALDRFDPWRGVPFPAYATSVISGHLKRHFRDRTWVVHVPRSLQERHLRARNASDDLRSRLGRSPTLDELAADMNATPEETREALSLQETYRVLSTDLVMADQREPVLAHRLGRPEPGFGDVERRIALEQALKRLPSDDRLLVRLYYWEALTQEEIAQRIGWTQVRVSRRLRKVCIRMRFLFRPPAAASTTARPESCQ